MAGPKLHRRRRLPFPLVEVALRGATRAQLHRISEDLALGLSAEEMGVIQAYFATEGRDPTDVELQSLAQAWSEHCCYKSSRVFLREFVFGIDAPDVLARGDAGVMAFDEEHAYALRIESHNHPSAVEPYGGAATGIGGILRDVLCMGAQPIALVDPLFFGPLGLPEARLPKGIKHPRYLLGGVVAGIRDYGNRVGIPTLSGGLWFDPRYVGNCIVNVGCVGFAKRSEIRRNAVRGPGDLLVLVGGLTGRDGIHGVTFASAVITEESEEASRGAVQLGDPIMKEPLIHAVLEANRAGLVQGMKDLGGGGLSCVVGEIALAGGCGAIVHLERVPLKEARLAPWEIWVSESQERMMLAVRPEDLPAVLELFRLYDVPATAIGEVVPERRVRLYYRGVQVFELDLEFLTRGPEYCRPFAPPKRPSPPPSERAPPLPREFSALLLELLGSVDLCSRDWVVRQYDHEVRGATVLKPLQGRLGHSSHGDAAVLQPRPDSYRGLAIATAANPHLCAIDPHEGAIATVDELVRNLTAVGARPHALTNCMNFGNPEKPVRLWEFREAVRGVGEACAALRIAVPSGNVSFYNESPDGAIPPTPVLLGCGIVEDLRRCVTSDLKESSDPLFLVGTTQASLGGSALYRLKRGRSRRIPRTDLLALQAGMALLQQGIAEGSVVACHDVSEGGLAAALAEMCIGGQLGAQVHLDSSGLPAVAQLFSESPSRWVVEVRADRAERFAQAAAGRATPLGELQGDRLTIERGRKLVDVSVGALEAAWSRTLWEAMG